MKHLPALASGNSPAPRRCWKAASFLLLCAGVLLGCGHHASDTSRLEDKSGRRRVPESAPRMPPTAVVRHAEFSPDGKLLFAIYSWEKGSQRDLPEGFRFLRLWDVETG